MYKQSILRFLLPKIILPGLFTFSGIFAQEPFLPDNPLKGARVFEQKGCISCHAIYGDGGKIAADLGNDQFKGGFLKMASAMWNHFPNMKSAIREKNIEIPSFTPQEMEDLYAYLFCLPYFGESGDERRGDNLLTQKDCRKCHGKQTSSGKRVAAFEDMKKYGAPVYPAQTMWNHGPEMQKQMDKMGIKRPDLTGEDMIDIAAYLQSVSSGAIRENVYLKPGNPKAGASVFKVKRCSECHSIREGKSRYSAPDLGQAEKMSSPTQIASQLWNHTGEMSRLITENGIMWPRFTGQEMADLIAYLYYLKFNDPAGDFQKGKEVFNDKKCSLCHVWALKRDESVVYRIPLIESTVSMMALMWNHASRMDSMMTNEGIEWPEFTLDEMINLYSYLKEATVKNE